MLRRAPAGLLLIAIVCVLHGCSSASGGVASASAAAGGRPQTDAEIAQAMRDLKPTERIVPNADARLLWQATSGYMQRAFPLDELPADVAQGPGGARQIRTNLVEWTGEGLPHRTRVFVEVRPDAGNAANMRLRVTALQIDGEPQLAQAREGQPLRYAWRLSGSNPRIEELVADQILKRYEALRAGLPLPTDEEMVVPVQRGA